MKVLKLSPEKFEETIKEVVSVFRNGGVVVVPTDTIYGLAADALNPEAVKRIFEIKQRPEEKTLPIFVESIEEAEQLTEINARQRKFLEKVWPGKVTAVLKAKDGSTIALRIPKHDFVSELLKEFGGPLTGTSANLSGKPGHIKITELIAEFENAHPNPDIIIDTGDLLDLKPSTVIDLTVWPPQILREGAVSKEEIMRYIEGL